MINKKLNEIYLVIDPAADQSILEEKVPQALEYGVSILQIWNHWPDDVSRSEKENLIGLITNWADDYDAPVLINDDWKMLQSTRLDGVHFDAVPDDFENIKSAVGFNFIAGITCGNDLDTVRWADEYGLDYISFCAMFPSPSSGSCAIVRPATVQQARKITDLPLFLSGGITPENIHDELTDLDFDGVAVISGILNADEPGYRTRAYKKALEKN